MIVGIGVDLCENERVLRLYNRYGERFLRRIYTPEEISYCMGRKQPASHLAARFAVKEAFIKALGLKRSLGLSYQEVGLWGQGGKKNIVVSGVLKQHYQKIADNMHFSISHAHSYSNAVVVLERYNATTNT